MTATADKFTDTVYDTFIKMADERKRYPVCREPERAALGFKCIPLKKKYTIILIESDTEIIICEFVASKLIYW